MSETYVVIDCPYLCHRAHYTTGSLTHNGVATGVVFGFLRSLHTLKQELGSSKFIFCFDEGPFLRQELCPTYKKARRDKQKTMTDVERESYKNLQEQIRLLRTEYLAELGYNNVFSQQGYEADDVIAGIVDYSISGFSNVVIVSADKDLYQLLTSNRVSIYEIQKRRFYTRDNFLKDYGIAPDRWAAVKAIAGCSSDGIMGLKGIGEKTAIKYLKCEESRKTIAQNKLIKISSYWVCSESDMNLKLTTIPFPGINQFELQKDKVTQKKWDVFIKRFGMASLKEMP